MKKLKTTLLSLIIASGTFAQVPTVAAPTPTDAAADVISLFSDAYTDVPVDTWNTVWSSATYALTSAAGDPVHEYTNLDFNGIETVGPNQIDASSMTHIHFDAWTNNATVYRIKLVDFGADGNFGGGDDSEHEIEFTSPTTGAWTEHDIILTDFIGLANTSNISQYIISALPTGTADLYLDNVYFSDQGAATFPPNAAPTPTHAAADVISLFSDAYTDVAVDTWNTVWSSATYNLTAAAGDPIHCYTNLDFNGIETVGANMIDASGMTHFRMDVWSPDATSFSIKLVDFGADGNFGGGDDSEHQIDFAAPAIGSWVEYDIPLADFLGLTGTSNIAQYIIVAQPTGTASVYMDNVYFRNQGTPPATFPTTAAPTPTDAAADVISLFSDAYTDVAVDTWNTVWSSATYNLTAAAGDPIHCYTNLDFNGIETVGANLIDASGMTHFHMDVWSPDATFFGIKLVDFGADGAFGGGDDTEHQINYTTPAIGSWVEYDIPLTDFIGLTNTSNIAQYIIVAQPTGTASVYIDNVYFSDQGTTPPVTFPTTAAPTPTQAAADVISLFSDAYTDVAVDTWNTVWSSATYSLTAAAGDPIHCYTNLDFNGIETVGANMIDASGMTYFHMDVWSPDATSFSIKLVDFGADGNFGGGDDSEHQIDFAAPAIGSWVEYDIPLADFVGLTGTSNIAQYIIVAQPTGTASVYMDNVYFSYEAPTFPLTAAPTPTDAAADVISLFSDAYTDVAVDTWNTVWSSATYNLTAAAGDPIHCYTNLDFNGIETVGANMIDASGMTHFHLDVWSPDATSFSIKLVDFGADGNFGGGDDSEHQIDFATPAIGSWVEYDILLTDFVGLASTSNIAQYIIVAQPTGTASVYIDNVYFSNQAPVACSDVTLELTTDANGSETSWEIIAGGSVTPICSGSGYSSNSVISEVCCLPDGCYQLRVLDSMGDGMFPGGYVLRDVNGDRIIDNEGDGNFGALSAIAGSREFCIPMGTDRLQFGSCDNESLEFGDFIIAASNPAVTAEFGGPNAATSGFQFWFFDPDGSYNRRIFSSHANPSQGAAPGTSAVRHLAVLQWSTLPVPADVKLNVRVRSRVAGVNSAFGPACRIMVSTTTNCPTTQLLDDPSNQFFSCGVTKDFGGSDKIYATPLSGANKYQFEFVLASEGFLRRIASPNYVQILNWSTNPLEAGKMYDVRVRASYDGGTTYCDYGSTCEVFIANAPAANLSASNRSLDAVSSANLVFWPNPNSGDRLNIIMSDVDENLDQVEIVIFNMFGAQVQTAQVSVIGGEVNAAIDLNDNLATGMYMIHAVAGSKQLVERLMIEK